MSQKSSLPQLAKSVSQALMSDSRSEFLTEWSVESGFVRDDIEEASVGAEREPHRAKLNDLVTSGVEAGGLDVENYAQLHARIIFGAKAFPPGQLPQHPVIAASLQSSCCIKSIVVVLHPVPNTRSVTPREGLRQLSAVHTRVPRLVSAVAEIVRLSLRYVWPSRKLRDAFTDQRGMFPCSTALAISSRLGLLRSTHLPRSRMNSCCCLMLAGSSPLREARVEPTPQRGPKL